jgi:hypothetical protein
MWICLFGFAFFAIVYLLMPVGLKKPVWQVEKVDVQEMRKKCAIFFIQTIDNQYKPLK